MRECKLPEKCWCLSCRKKYDAKRYQKIKKKRYKQTKDRRKKLTKWYRKLKSHPCTDCGMTFHPAAMQFDHTSSEDKRNNVANLVSMGLGKKTVLAEIEKCDLVCANCHAIRTFNRREKS